MAIKIDTNFDFTQDTEGYWKNWWTKENGDDLIGTKYVYDPDSQSKTLNEYHKFLWSKKLPTGKNWDLVSNVRPVRSFPKTTATFPSHLSAKSVNSSGRRSLPLRFFPRRLVVPAAQTQSALACVMLS